MKRKLQGFQDEKYGWMDEKKITRFWDEKHGCMDEKHLDVMQNPMDGWKAHGCNAKRGAIEPLGWMKTIDYIEKRMDKTHNAIAPTT